MITIIIISANRPRQSARCTPRPPGGASEVHKEGIYIYIYVLHVCIHIYIYIYI